MVVVGGGITGICVAREAASRGLDVVLVEANDFGSGTSASTTKYIHGGIRYLEQYDIEVVRESLRERRILALGAPHLVEQTRFIMPAWRWSKPPTALIGAGVLLYDILSFDRNRNAPSSLRIPHPRWMSRRNLLRAVPWLDPRGLQGAFAYHDTMNIHPERLLLAYAKSAALAGARLWVVCASWRTGSIARFGRGWW
jgi:glycerol-3-phosphate dehydrogenase